MQTPNLLYRMMEARDLLGQVLVNPPTVELADIDFDTDLSVVGNQMVSFDGGSFTVTPIKVIRKGIVEVEAIEWSLNIRVSEDTFRTEQAVVFDAALDRIATVWMQDQLANIAQNRAEALAMLEVERVQG